MNYKLPFKQIKIPTLNKCFHDSFNNERGWRLSRMLSGHKYETFSFNLGFHHNIIDDFRGVSELNNIQRHSRYTPTNWYPSNSKLFFSGHFLCKETFQFSWSIRETVCEYDGIWFMNRGVLEVQGIVLQVNTLPVDIHRFIYNFGATPRPAVLVNFKIPLTESRNLHPKIVEWVRFGLCQSHCLRGWLFWICKLPWYWIQLQS